MEVLAHGFHPSVSGLDGEVAASAHGLEHGSPICTQNSRICHYSVIFLHEDTELNWKFVEGKVMSNIPVPMLVASIL
jgi:hypothetical protein